MRKNPLILIMIASTIIFYSGCSLMEDDDFSGNLELVFEFTTNNSRSWETVNKSPIRIAQDFDQVVCMVTKSGSIVYDSDLQLVGDRFYCDIQLEPGSGYNVLVACYENSFSTYVGSAFGLTIVGGETTSDTISLTVLNANLFPTSNSATDVVVVGNYAYVANWYSGLRVVDVSNPLIPFEVSTCGGPSFATGVTVSGNYAYVADWGDGLSIIDISNPLSPVEVGSCSTEVAAHNVAVSGNYAYVADDMGGLRIVNISNPNNPVEAGFYDPPNENLQVFDVTISGDRAFILTGVGLRVVDVSNPNNPIAAGSADPPGFGGEHMTDLTTFGNYAYVAAGDYGFWVIDITNPDNPATIGFYDIPGFACAVAVSGEYAYVAYESYEYSFGFSLFNVSIPNRPIFIGFGGFSYSLIENVALNGNCVFLAGEAGLRIIDITPFL